DLFFSPIQQLSQVFDSWQQTRVSVGRIADLMAIETRTPPADAPLSPGRLLGELAFESVRFAYPTGPNRPDGGTRAGPERRGPADMRSLRSADAVTVRPPRALQGVELRIGA